MPAINFKDYHEPLILSGEKRQTIRKKRKNPIKVGDTLSLYTKMRTKNCRLIKKVTCKELIDLKIDERFRLHLNGEKITLTPLYDDFANFDGFKDYCGLLFFIVEHYGPLPFEGQVIKW